jgi:hypothetical protein
LSGRMKTNILVAAFLILLPLNAVWTKTARAEGEKTGKNGESPTKGDTRPPWDHTLHMGLRDRQKSYIRIYREKCESQRKCISECRHLYKLISDKSRLALKCD